MKKLLQFFLFTALLFSSAMPLRAIEAGDVFTRENFEFEIRYNRIEEHFYLSLTKYHPDEPVSQLYDVEIPGNVSYNGLNLPVTVIGEAFKECQQIRSVKIPDGVTGLYSSFFNCKNLEEVFMPNSVTYIFSAFEGCSRLSNITLSNSLRILDYGSFYDCVSLTSIDIPQGVETIGQNAFKGCDGLTEIVIPKSVTKILYNAFSECDNLKKVVFEDGEEPLDVSENIFWTWKSNYQSYYYYIDLSDVYLGRDLIGSYPFRSFYSGTGSEQHDRVDSSIKSLTIGNTVKEIRSNEFFDCNNLTTVDFGESITKIGEYAFTMCSLWEGINLPNSVTIIEKGAFQNSYPRTISLGESIVTIGEQAFSVEDQGEYEEDGEYHFFVSELVIPNSVKQIGSEAFGGYGYFDSLTLGSSLAEIGKDAFQVSVKELTFIDGEGELDISEQRFFDVETLYLGRSLICNSPFEPELTKATIGNTVTSIGATTFSGCSGLTEIVIPNSVETIGKRAFSGCSGFSSITIPESVKSIGEEAFDNCRNIDEVMSPSLSAWLDIEFGDQDANPLKNATKFIVDGVTVRRMTLPEGTERINAYAFANYKSLVSVNFPAGVKSVGNYAFDGASGLQRFTFNNAVDYLGIGYDSAMALLPTGNSGTVYINQEPYVQEHNMVWPKELKKIPDYAFYGNKDLYDLVVPDDLVSIGKYAFAFSWLDRVTTASAKDNAETSVLPMAITEIPEACFQGTFLEQVVIPARVKSLDNYAFWDCSRLRQIVYEGTPEIIGHSFNYYTPSVEIPDVNAWAGVVVVPTELFYPSGEVITNNIKIENLVLEPAEDIVNSWTFSGMPVNNVRVKASSIGFGAFYKSSMQRLCVETQDIWDNAFNSCNNLQEVYSLTAIPPTAEDNVFSKYDGVTLYVPKGARAAYENTETCWCQFLDIVETDFEDVDELFKANYEDPNTGIEPISVADAGNEPQKVYNLSGIYLGDNTDNLPGGIYIIRQGSSVKKIKVD